MLEARHYYSRAGTLKQRGHLSLGHEKKALLNLCLSDSKSVYFFTSRKRYLEGLPRYLEFLRISKKISKAIFALFVEKPNAATESLSAVISGRK